MRAGLGARLAGSLAVAGLTLAFVIVPFLLFGPWLEARALQRLAGAEGAALALGSGALLALDIFLPVPSSLVAIATGAMLGLPLGAAVIWLGMSLGCVLGFYAGRGAGPIARAVGGDAGHAALAGFVRRWGWLALVVMRPVPVLAEASLLIASACGLGPRSVLAATLPANLAIAILYAHVGAAFAGDVPLALLVFASVGAPALLALGARVSRAGQRTGP